MVVLWTTKDLVQWIYLFNENKCWVSTDCSDIDIPEEASWCILDDAVMSVVIYRCTFCMRLPLKVKNTGDLGVNVAFRNWVVATHKEIKADIITIPIKI